MKAILVPCDFSGPAKNAFRFALQIASRNNAATVHLLYVIQLPVVMDPIVMPVVNYEDSYKETLQIDAEKQFDKLKQAYRHESKDVKVFCSLQFGSIATTILNYISTASIDLIVMGTHGTTGLRDLFIGSNTEKIVKRSTVPVFVVKDNFRSGIKDIVFPNSFKLEDQDELIEQVKQLQEFFKAKIHLLHINTPGNFIDDELMISRMHNFVSHFYLSNYTINIYNSTDVEEGIHQFTTRIKAGLIAIGTHGYGRLVHLVNGGLAQDMTNHSDIMIWTYSPSNAVVEI